MRWMPQRNVVPRILMVMKAASPLPAANTGKPFLIIVIHFLNWLKSASLSRPFTVDFKNKTKLLGVFKGFLSWEGRDNPPYSSK